MTLRSSWVDYSLVSFVSMIMGHLELRLNGRSVTPGSRRCPQGQCLLTNRWSGRVKDKVRSSYVGVRAAQLNR